MKKKAVIFDFDGTLADSLPVLLESYNAIAPRFRLLKVKPEDIDDYRKLSYREMFRKVKLRSFMLPMIIRAGTRELRKRRDNVRLFPGIPELLNDLVASGHKVGVLTSNESDVVTKILRNHGVVGLDFVVSQRALFAKDKAFRKIEKVQKLRSEEIVYVGDESRDVVACRKVGIDVIGVTWGLGGAQAFEREAPNDIVDTIPKLRILLTKKYL